MVLCHFYWQGSRSISKTDLKQKKKWKYNFLINAIDKINPAFNHDPTNHDPGHPMVCKKNVVLVLRLIESHGFPVKISKQAES